MKLGQILPPVLLGAAAIGLCYAYGLAGPERHVRELRSALAQVNAETSAARNSIEEVLELENKSAAIRKRLARDGHAATSPVVWFPQQMSKCFAQFGIQDVATRVNTGVPEPGLPGYQRTYWAVTLPLGQNAAALDDALLAVSELEAADPFVRVHSVSASGEGGREILGGQSATVTVSLLTRQF